MLALYGLVTTIDAGVYARIGEVAALPGFLAPMAFLVASLLAGVPALSFAELSSRFPRSAGEAVYAREGLGLDSLAVVVGLMVVAAGLVSAATVINGLVGNFQDLVAPPRGLIIVVLALVPFAIAAWGIGGSAAIAAILTVVEAGGLATVIWAGGFLVTGGFPIAEAIRLIAG